MAWLAEHGEFLDDAEADLRRWKSWPLDDKKRRALREAETAARHAQEQAAKEKGAKEQDAGNRGKANDDG